MKSRKKKLAPYFGDVMDVYYILDEQMGYRVLMGQMPWDGKETPQGTFKVERGEKGDHNLLLSPKDKDKHVRVLYYAMTVYQLDIPKGATKIPLRIDKQ